MRPRRVRAAPGFVLVRIGRTSMEIALEVWARDLAHLCEPERAFVGEAVFHYIAVDAEGRPRPLPDNPDNARFFAHS